MTITGLVLTDASITLKSGSPAILPGSVLFLEGMLFRCSHQKCPNVPIPICLDIWGLID